MKHLFVTLAVLVPVLAAAEPVTRLAFGSCCRENRAAPIFSSITKFEPHVWIWMGDNIYADTTEMAVMEILHEVTSSGLNTNPGGSPTEVNKRRIGENFRGTNFGTLEIDWSASPPLLRFALRNEQDEAVRELKIHP